MSVKLTWDDTELQKLFNELTPQQQHKYHSAAMRSAAKKLQAQVKQDAAAKGFGATGPAENNGWRWIRYGRIPRAITVGKLWRKGTRQTIRVFSRNNKRYGFAGHAPHTHLVVLGHNLFIPQRDGSTVKIRKTAGVPVYQEAYGGARILFTRELEASVRRMVKRFNRKAGIK